MTQRVLTGLILAAVAAVLLAVGGLVMAGAIVLVVALAVFEEFRALGKAGHRPVAWPTWIGLASLVPMLLLDCPFPVMFVVMALVCLATITGVIFRKEPSIVDCMMSLIPFLTLVLPGLGILTYTGIENRALQLTMMVVFLAVPCVCDIFALFVGRTFKGPKLCPAVSPNKTISGSIGGMVGGLLAALAVGGIAYLCAPAARAVLPPWWHYMLLGLIGGAVGQVGDLFASLVKRHSGLKDFSNLFPGHGGMLDRMDSIIFMAVVMFCYRLLVLI